MRQAIYQLCLLAALLPGRAAIAQEELPSPAQVLGFVPGTDSVLADWTQITRYLSVLATASPHMRLDTIGHSTLGRPMLLATFATPERMTRLADLRAGQQLLADPRRLLPEAADSLQRVQPAVVLINNNIHSTEVTSSQTQLTLAYRLAADPAYRSLLDSVIVLLVPSANPDGLDTTVSWYRQYRGTDYESGPMPWLYHPYTGHDNNRDWFMLTQVETRVLTRVLYQEWFPQVVWDVHEMDNRGARLFVPPFADPVNPNLDPMLVGAINLVGTTMAASVLDAGRTGVSHRRSFDLWWHGGFRTVPARHNMVGILSESAGARLGSPVYQNPDDLRQPQRGIDYPAPWTGGWWRMSDIRDDQLLAARGLLTLIAARREAFVSRFVTLGRRAIAAGEAGGPSAFLMPPEQWDRGRAAWLANLLLAAGIDVRRATAGFSADGRRYPAGTLIVPMAQPFRAHAKDLLEPQRYPDRRAYPGGPPLAPYDVSGWTLGLQMGVEVVQVEHPFQVSSEPLDTVVPVRGAVHGTGRYRVLLNRSNAESGIIAAAMARGADVSVAAAPWHGGEGLFPAGTVVIDAAPAGVGPTIELDGARRGFDVWRTDSVPRRRVVVSGLPRIGLYQPWAASMDEGWTRWVLEQHGIPHVTVHDSVIRRGGLGEQLDVLILPSLAEETIVSGHSQSQIPHAYAGGIGEEGVRHITEFVQQGGTLVTLGSSSDFAISALNLPVRNILRDESDEDQGSRFLAPGSIFGVLVRTGDPVASGLPDTAAVFYREGAVFAADSPATVVAQFLDDPLRSGFALNVERIEGRAALVTAPVGRGRAILFGFRPQHRGQTHGTFKLLFNAVLLSAGP